MNCRRDPNMRDFGWDIDRRNDIQRVRQAERDALSEQERRGQRSGGGFMPNSPPLRRGSPPRSQRPPTELLHKAVAKLHGFSDADLAKFIHSTTDIQ
jgi:hypothetical protein